MAVLALVSVGGWLFYSHNAHALGPTDTIVISNFTNRTGDAVFDDTLEQGLAVQLAQSPFINIFSDEKVRNALKLMGHSPDERLTPEIARDLCQRVGSKACLNGSIVTLGNQYVISLNAVNCRSGDFLAREQVTADSKERALKALDQAARRIREKVGESLSTIQSFNTPLEKATTPSLEALKAYSAGRRHVSRQDPAAAVPLFQRAVHLDTSMVLFQCLVFDPPSATQLPRSGGRSLERRRGKWRDRSVL